MYTNKKNFYLFLRCFHGDSGDLDSDVDRGWVSGPLDRLALFDVAASSLA